MKVDIRTAKCCLFGDLYGGDCFMYGKDLFIKTDNVLLKTGERVDILAINLASGSVIYPSDTLMVTPIPDAKVVVE